LTRSCVQPQLNYIESGLDFYDIGSSPQMKFDVGIAGGIDHEHFEECESTQKFSYENWQNFNKDKLKVVSADFQTSGIGKGNRSWTSIRGKGVLVTYTFHFPDKCDKEFCNKNVQNTSHVLALSAMQALQAALTSIDAKPELRLKWPNDILVNNHKMGGILAKAEPGEGGRVDTIIIGIGLNINTSKDELTAAIGERIVWPASSLLAECGTGVSDFNVPQIRDMMTVGFFHNLQVFCNKGFSAFLGAVDKLQTLKGEDIQFNLDDQTAENPDACKVKRGTFVGLAEDGALMLRTSDSVQTMHAGEIIPLCQ